MVQRLFVFGYGLIAYLLFFITILHLIAFVGNWIVPKSIDSGASSHVLVSVVVNLSLIALFAIQHTIMARPAFKERWTRILPKALERSTFVLATVMILQLMFWQWRPLAGTIWHCEDPLVRIALSGISLGGWGILFYSSFLIDHFDLFGMRQVTLFLLGKPYSQRPFVERSLYKRIRHPLMTGVLIGIWVTPTMTWGHLLFALGFSSYIAMGVMFEERDLVRQHGEEYEAYRQRTRKFWPLPKAAPLQPQTPTPSTSGRS